MTNQAKTSTIDTSALPYWTTAVQLDVLEARKASGYPFGWVSGTGRAGGAHSEAAASKAARAASKPNRTSYEVIAL